MTKGFFITATDTDAGKTFVATKLLTALNDAGYSTAALKPIASGCTQTEGGLRNSDALQLQAAASLKFNYAQVNPYAFEPPIAPHVAAAQTNIHLSAKQIIHDCQPILSSNANYIIVEGAGGWKVPLNQNEMWDDFCRLLQFPIILVVGMKLGCLNHTLLTWESLQHSKLPVAGWIANCVDPNMLERNSSIETLQNNLPIPLLSIVPYGAQKIELANQYR